jgi:hypothetical protein
LRQLSSATTSNGRYSSRPRRYSDAELTEPYAVLFAADLTDDVLAEAEAIKAQAAQRTPESQSDSPEPFGSGCSYFVKLAEGEGFEPSRQD